MADLSSLMSYLLKNGIRPPHHIRQHGFTRFGHNNRYYLLSFPSAWYFGDWVTGRGTAIPDENSSSYFSVEEKRRLKAERRRLFRQYQKDEKILHEKTASLCLEIWNSARPASPSHAYLVKKGVRTHGIRQEEDSLLIPLFDVHGRLWSLQKIFPDGTKRFMAGGRTKGLFYPLGEWKSSSRLVIVEGFATAATIHEATAFPVICAFNVGNLGPVISNLLCFGSSRYHIIIAADNDYQGENMPNPGLDEGRRLASSYHCSLVYPAGNSKIDFNDIKNSSQIMEYFKNV